MKPHVTAERDKIPLLQKVMFASGENMNFACTGLMTSVLWMPFFNIGLGLKPYVLVRGRLEALVARAVMYEMIEHGEEIDVGGVPTFAVRSHGMVFPIMPAERLKRLSA